MEKIVIGREAYNDIMYYVNKTNLEISGFGAVEVIGGVPTVTSIYLMDQENSSAETELDGTSIAKAEYEHIKSGKPGELRFWWHSHVNMGVFWSGTDLKAIEVLTENGWFIHGVFNKKYESKIAYTNNDPVSVFIDDIDLEIDESMVHPTVRQMYEEIAAIEDSILKERSVLLDSMFEKHVTIKTYNYNKDYRRNNIFPGDSNAWRNDYDPFSTVYELENRTIKGAKPFSEKNDSDFLTDPEYDYLGYCDLFDMGHTHDEIIVFNSKGVFTPQDLKDFEEKARKA